MKSKKLTAAELEASVCTRRKEKPRHKHYYWEGMNSRDETDECFHTPVGRGLATGFRMANPDYDGADA